MKTPKHTQLLSIGALARAVGVPVETLRTWERRHGVPVPERTDSGHRRYSLATLERLRLVRAAMQAGHRASLALHATEDDLRVLAAGASRAELRSLEPSGRAATDAEGSIARWIELIRRFDGVALERELHSALAALGALAFLEQRVAPLLREVGERWHRADVGVCHEHYASERIQDFLSRQWKPLSDAATGPVAVCATTAGERHTLGLQMAVFTLALNNLRVLYLGADLPASEIAEAAQQHTAAVIVLSAACGSDRDRLEHECAALRAATRPERAIVVGGSGFAGTLPGLIWLGDLLELNAWAQEWAK